MIWNMILQICFVSFIPIYYSRQICTLQDGGEIAIDFAYDSKKNKEKGEKIGHESDLPIVVLVPGYGGHNDDIYILK